MKLPDSWELVSLEYLGTWKGGGTPNKSEPRYWNDGTVPWISPKDMKINRIADTEDHITLDAISESNVRLLTAGSVVVVTRSGILQRTLPVAITTVEATMNQDLKGLTPHDGVEPLYVCYVLRCFEREILQTCSKNGTTVASIEFPRLLSFKVPLAPLAEQRRIVAAIEEQFSRLDAAVASLERARANLKRYRAAVLHGAVTGIFATQSGVVGSRDFCTPSIEEGTRSDLPEGWTWTPMRGLVREPLRNGHSARASKDGQGVRTLTLTAVTKRDFSERNTKLTTADPDRVRDLWLQNGDILLERSNTPELVGTACVFRGESNFAIFPDLLIRIRTCEERVSSSYIDLVLRSEHGRRYFRGRAQGIAGSMPKIDQRTVEDFPVPLPDKSIQDQIVFEVERRFSIVDQMEQSIENALKRAEQLRQAILKRAFAGELAPQDPSDEPASVLLEHIRVEQAAARSARPKRSANRKRNSDSKQPALM